MPPPSLLLHSTLRPSSPQARPPMPATQHHSSPPRVLGISLFDGIGSFWLSLQPFAGTAFECAEQVSCEVDEASVRVLEHRFPDVKHWGDTSKASAARLNELVSRVRPDFVRLNGSCPSLHLSRAHAAGEGLGEDSPFWEYVRVAGIVREACLTLSVRLIQLFDCVVPRLNAWQDSMTEALRLGPPLLLDAADFSYCSRPRLVWSNATFPPFLSSRLSEPDSTNRRLLTLPRSCRHLPPLSAIFQGAAVPRCGEVRNSHPSRGPSALRFLATRRPPNTKRPRSSIS